MRSLRRPAFVKRHRSSTTTWHKMHITQAMQPALLVGMQTVTLTAAQCLRLADEHKARAKVPSLSLKQVSLHTNIARSFSGLASQLDACRRRGAGLSERMDFAPH